MKRTTTIFVFLLFAMLVQAQVSFKTIVPQQPVIAGESFQVQYIIEDGEKTANVKPPFFNNFRFVAGPNIYMGSVSTATGVKPLKNSVYTLEAVRPGRYVIPGATITVNGKTIRSNDALVEVISKEEAVRNFNKENGISSSDYFLKPGENAYEKIKQNLFIKVMLDKRTCFVGEPVLATFKLYSRLESKSDIIKNPGFYGFTVYDMVSLTDKQMVTEKINGKTFDVHTIRKVQLYPLQAGVFTIDPMLVKNKVEFSRSAVGKKTEQEVTEGLLGGNDNEAPAGGTDLFETDISTGPVSINVKPVPAKNKPSGFDGATGRFSITAALAKNNLSKNEEGFLEITIQGKGNFIQISAPAVQWPPGVESFEPAVKDNLDKTTMPLSGSRTFRYPFVCTVAGTYRVPPVTISFFDTDSNIYKTISTGKVDVQITNEDKKIQVTEEHKTSIAEKSEKAARMAGLVVLGAVLLILAYWIFGKKEPEIVKPVTEVTILFSAAELLEPASIISAEEGNRFYSTLHSIIWKFAAERLGLSGSEMTKYTLVAKMNALAVDPAVTTGLFKVLEQCETAMFTNASLEDDKSEILSTTKGILENIYSATVEKKLL